MAAAAQGDRKPMSDDQRVKHEQADTADKAELLGQGREDEIGLLFRQEAQMALAAVEKTSPQETARAERDFRLQNVITGTQRVALRIEKGIDPVLLVVAEEMPSGRHGGSGTQRHQREVPQADAGYEEQRNPGYQQHHRSPEVGLFQHQRCGYQDHQRGRYQVSET